METCKKKVEMQKNKQEKKHQKKKSIRIYAEAGMCTDQQQTKVKKKKEYKEKY